MKCECVVFGHCARIELSLYLSLGSIGLIVMMTDARFVPAVQSLVLVHLESWAVMIVVMVIVGVVVVAVATIKVQATMKAAQVVTPVADASFVPVVQSPAPVHLERCSFQQTHSRILPHSNH